MDLRDILFLIFATGSVALGILGRAVGAEATPREGAILSYWLIEPNQLTEKGVRLRRHFIKLLLFNVFSFLAFLILLEKS